MAEQQVNIYATYTSKDAYFALSEEDKKVVRAKIAGEAAALTPGSHLYSVFPCRADADFMLWSAIDSPDPSIAAKTLTDYNTVSEGWKQYIKPVQVLWGFTRPSMYSRGKSEQDIDAIEGPRCKFFIVYPFSKTKEWFLMSMDARQGMMNEHIKIGKQFFDIKQLLIYSFGLQDYEFVVGYEANDLARFSELVQQLRSTEGRRHTLFDSPLVTGVHRTAEAFAS